MTHIAIEGVVLFATTGAAKIMFAAEREPRWVPLSVLENQEPFIQDSDIRIAEWWLRARGLI